MAQLFKMAPPEWAVGVFLTEPVEGQPCSDLD